MDILTELGHADVDEARDKLDRSAWATAVKTVATPSDRA